MCASTNCVRLLFAFIYIFQIQKLRRHSKGPSKCQNNNYFFVYKNMSTMYISSFYRNIQKEFYTKDTKKSRLVKTIEYFDKSKKLTPKPSNEPEIRKISREMNHVSVSTQKPANSTLLNRPTEKSNRFENSNRSSRRFSLAESQKRSRSLLRSTEVERTNPSQTASRIRKNSTQRRLSIQNTNFRYSRNIKSNKSTEGTKSKVRSTLIIFNFNEKVLPEIFFAFKFPTPKIDLEKFIRSIFDLNFSYH